MNENTSEMPKKVLSALYEDVANACVWFFTFGFVATYLLTNATRRSVLHISIAHLPISRTHGAAPNQDYIVIYGINLSQRFVKFFLFICAHIEIKTLITY